MKNFLPGISSCVEDDSVSLFIDPDVTGNLAGLEQDMTQQVHFVIRKVIERSEVLLGYDQNVDRRLRVDVMERNDPVVLKDQLGRDLFIYDLTENATLHIFSFCRLPISL